MRPLYILLLLISTTVAHAQSNLGCYYDSLMSQILCGNMSIQGDPDNICDDGVHLWVNITPNSSYSDSLVHEAFGSTDSFKVVQRPYNFEQQTTPISANLFTDDYWSQIIPLPFKFCFFENKYTSLIIGANGQISFDLTQAGLVDNWSTLGWPPLPYSNTTVNNAIFCPYQDIYPTVGGTIDYSVEGVAPCRKFIITWNNVPMFSCTSLIATQQIVLHEGSYRIDMNVANKPLCASWNSGNAYMGLQNPAGTIAYTVPGCNGGQWTANNQSWSFIPVGNHNLTTGNNSITQGIYWVDSATNNVIGFGDTLNYWPPTDTTIYVFFGDTTLLNDTCFLSNIDTCINACGKGYICSGTNPYIRLHYIKPLASFTYTMNSSCAGATVQFSNSSTNANSYLWNFGDGTFDTQPNPTHTYIGTGPFVVTLVATGLGCSDTAIAVIVPTLAPVYVAFTLSDDSVCTGSTLVTSNNSSIGSNLSYTWTMGDGTTYNTFNISHTYIVNGTYTVWLVIKDTLNNCTDSTSQIIYADDNSLARFSISPTSICVGQQVYIYDTLNANTLNFQFDMGNGNTIVNVNNPSHTYLTAGDFTITLQTTYPVCPMQLTSQTVHVEAYPVVDLGPMEEICPGRSSVIIHDDNNPGASYVWSTGETTNSITVNVSGIYQVTVAYGECKTKAEKDIAPDLDCIFIPNAFTPNGDGTNDYFKPVWYDIKDIGAYQIMIYNRFGQQIYTSDDKTEKGWNGMFKGQPCEMSTYMYYMYIVGNDGTSKYFKGDVILMR